MAERCEYDVVDVTGRSRHSPGALSPVVREREGRGWVLMTVVTDPSAYGGRTWAYFKRPVQDLLAA